MPSYTSAPSLNYPGSSGYGYDASGRYTRVSLPSEKSFTYDDYGVWDGTQGKVVSVNTGKPFTGKDPITGKTFDAGVESKVASSTATIDPNNPKERYQPVDIIKSQPIADTTSELLKTFKDNAASSLKGFPDYLKNYQSDIAGARTKSLDAQDIAPTVGALQGATSRYGANLDAAQQTAAGALATGSANERAVIQAEKDTLPMYDTAANNIANRQLQAVQANLSRYKLGSGTPASLGSAETQILAKNAGDVLLPLEQAKIQRRYDIYGRELPTEQGITGRNVSYGENFLPGVASGRYSSESGLANAVQSLKNQVASMSFDEAGRYMQSLGVPDTIRQQVLSGQLTQLGALGQLEESSRYRGLQDKLGVNVSQPQYYSLGTGSYPNYTPQTSSRYSDNPSTGSYGYGGNQLSAPNAPRTVSSGASIAPQGTTYGIDASGNAVAYAPGANPFTWGNSANRYPNTGIQNNAYFDASTGTIRNRYGDLVGTQPDSGYYNPDIIGNS